MGFGVGVLNCLGDAPVVEDFVTGFASPSPNSIELFLIPARAPGPRPSNALFSRNINEGLQRYFKFIDVIMREIDFVRHTIESETKASALVVAGDRLNAGDSAATSTSLKPARKQYTHQASQHPWLPLQRVLRSDPQDG